MGEERPTVIKSCGAPVYSGQLGTEAKAVKYMFVLCESSAFSVRHGFSKYTHLFLAAIFLLLCTYFLERCLIFSRDVFSSSIRERKWTRAFASIYYRRQIYGMLLSHVSAFFARAERDCVVGSGPPVHTVVIIFIFLTPVHLTHNQCTKTESLSDIGSSRVWVNR